MYIFTSWPDPSIWPLLHPRQIVCQKPLHSLPVMIRSVEMISVLLTAMIIASLAFAAPSQMTRKNFTVSSNERKPELTKTGVHSSLIANANPWKKKPVQYRKSMQNRFLLESSLLGEPIIITLTRTFGSLGSLAILYLNGVERLIVTARFTERIGTFELTMQRGDTIAIYATGGPGIQGVNLSIRSPGNPPSSSFLTPENFRAVRAFQSSDWNARTFDACAWPLAKVVTSKQNVQVPPQRRQRILLWAQDTDYSSGVFIRYVAGGAGCPSPTPTATPKAITPVEKAGQHCNCRVKKSLPGRRNSRCFEFRRMHWRSRTRMGHMGIELGPCRWQRCQSKYECVLTEEEPSTNRCVYRLVKHVVKRVGKRRFKNAFICKKVPLTKQSVILMPYT